MVGSVRGTHSSRNCTTLGTDVGDPSLPAAVRIWRELRPGAGFRAPLRERAALRPGLVRRIWRERPAPSLGGAEVGWRSGTWAGWIRRVISWMPLMPFPA